MTEATASAEGCRSGTCRQRDRIVTDTSSGWVDGVQSRKTVRGGRLLDGLEQRVAGLFGEAVGVLDEQDLPPAHGRHALRPHDQRAHLADPDGQPFRYDEAHVGVRPAERRAARLALAAATKLALQRGGERPGRDRARRSRPGR